MSICPPPIVFETDRDGNVVFTVAEKDDFYEFEE